MNTAARALTQSGLERGTLLAGLVLRRHLVVILLALAVFITGFGVVCIQDWQRRLFVKSQILVTERNQMQTQWGKLLLEQSAWSMQARIERVATTKLNMQLPNSKAIVMVQE